MKPRMPWIICLVLTLSCGTKGNASDKNQIEKRLRESVEKKVLSLRVPSAADKLQFDSNGKPVGTLLPAPWTTGGLLQVNKISLSRDGLRMECEQVLVALRTADPAYGPPAFAPVLTDRSVLVTIDLDPTALNAGQVSAVLAKVFEPVDVQQRIATYWKPSSGADVTPGPTDTGRIRGTLEGARPVYGASPGVEPPKPLSMPDPEYTPIARRKNIEGTTILMVVVNEKGLPEILEIVKGLGEGLDVKALAAVSQWRFKPAMRGGEPVAGIIKVEVTFRLR